MSHFDPDIAQALDDLFIEEPCAGHVVPLFRDLRTLMLPYVPGRLLVVDACGNLLAAEMRSPGDDDEPVHRCIRAIRAGVPPLDAGRRSFGDPMIFDVECAGQDGPDGYLFVVPQDVDEEMPRDAAWTARFAAARHLLCTALLRTAECDENAQRIKQMCAEQRTLMREHREIVAANLNDREAAVNDKQHLIAQLEEQVRARTQALHAALDEARAAASHKAQFLANMSHEIRTPLTALLGFAEMLQEPDLSPNERQHAVATLCANGRHLLTLINDILDLTKIESGNFPVELIPCAPVEIITHVATLLGIRAREKGLDLRVRYEPPIPARIRTDPTRLHQILTNLIGNALKFTHEGGIDVLARLSPQTPQGRYLIIRVADTGIGMTPEQIARVFEPFVQGDASTTRQYGGTGLGLSISRQLAKQLGGDIVVESAPNKGSVFEIRIATGALHDVEFLHDFPESSTGNPLPTSAPPVERNTRGRLDGVTILLAEDGPDNRRLITHILSKAGAFVTCVENGKAAVESALAAAGAPYDVILMDMQMPVMDGYTATRQLRESGYAGSIVALTAHATPQDRESCLQAGCDDYATKPIDRPRLIEIVRRGARLEP